MPKAGQQKVQPNYKDDPLCVSRNIIYLRERASIFWYSTISFNLLIPPLLLLITWANPHTNASCARMSRKQACRVEGGSNMMVTKKSMEVSRHDSDQEQDVHTTQQSWCRPRMCKILRNMMEDNNRNETAMRQEHDTSRRPYGGHEQEGNRRAAGGQAQVKRPQPG